MTTETEHRGWEIEDNYEQHWMDDADYDLMDDSEGGSWGVIVGIVIAAVVVLAGFYGLHLWLSPPVVTFAHPVVITEAQQQSQYFNMPAGWRIDCVVFDGASRIVRPNYENSLCTPQQSQKRGVYQKGAR